MAIEQEVKITPAAVIIPLGLLGLGLAGVAFVALAKPPVVGQVAVALKNPPAGSQGWDLYLYGANGGPIRMRENLAIDELAIWDDITEEEFPFQVTIDVFDIERVVLHHAQSRFPGYMNYYPNLLIYSEGSYDYNCATVEFELVE